MKSGGSMMLLLGAGLAAWWYFSQQQSKPVAGIQTTATGILTTPGVPGYTNLTTGAQVNSLTGLGMRRTNWRSWAA